MLVKANKRLVPSLLSYFRKHSLINDMHILEVWAPLKIPLKNPVQDFVVCPLKPCILQQKKKTQTLIFIYFAIIAIIYAFEYP